MSTLPNIEATVNLLKAILSEPLDLASEKRRFQGFLQDYAGGSGVVEVTGIGHGH